ncbi:MAG: hypothetical protein HY708_06115, partial [Ignavibacteriae bacterium]|nr:hypothetical protein [Ignavibacteriota bacterium]
MKKTRIAVLIVASMAGIHAAGAQVVLPDKHQPTGLHDHVFGLGLFGGAATGFGLSFRHHLP